MEISIKILENNPVSTVKFCWSNNEILNNVIDNKIKKNFTNGLFRLKPKTKKTLKYIKKITNKYDVLPNNINNVLEEIAPQNPKKLEISDFPTNLPIPGSFGL